MTDTDYLEDRLAALESRLNALDQKTADIERGIVALIDAIEATFESLKSGMP